MARVIAITLQTARKTVANHKSNAAAARRWFGRSCASRTPEGRSRASEAHRLREPLFMDGDIAPIAAIADVAERYDAMTLYG
jgi:hypothetical protein